MVEEIPSDLQDCNPTIGLTDLEKEEAVIDDIAENINSNDLDKYLALARYPLSVTLLTSKIQKN